MTLRSPPMCSNSIAVLYLILNTFLHYDTHYLAITQGNRHDLFVTKKTRTHQSLTHI